MVEARCWLDGEYVEGTGPTFKLHDPATEETVVEVHCASRQDVDRAVEAGKRAWPTWAKAGPEVRAACLNKWADLLEENAEELGKLEGRSMGQVQREARMHAGIAAGKLRYAAGLATTVAGETTLHNPGKISMVLRQPYGVTAGIIPWNVPLIMLAMKAGPALAAGNAIIIKTSEKAPLACALAAGFTKAAGFPPGIISVLTGAGETGRLIAEHMEIRKISFTGSTNTGRLVATAAVNSNLKEVSLELGGKSASIVFEDADLDKAANTLAFSLLWNTGQICMATTRVYVAASIADNFRKKYAAAVATFKQGSPSNPESGIGPLADLGQKQRVESYIEHGCQEKPPFYAGESVSDKGAFVAPVLFHDLSKDNKLWHEEIFGPVALVGTFQSEDEALSLANASDYGLYASVWTRDISRAGRVAQALEAGHVAVNAASPTGGNQLPLTGWKSSGFGSGDAGLEDVLHWTHTKAVIIDLE